MINNCSDDYTKIDAALFLRDFEKSDKGSQVESQYKTVYYIMTATWSLVVIIQIIFLCIGGYLKLLKRRT